jgi:hypothetical protein
MLKLWPRRQRKPKRVQFVIHEPFNEIEAKDPMLLPQTNRWNNV